MNKKQINEEIAIIDGAISQCEKLQKGETIKLNGLHNLTISRGKMTGADIEKKITELKQEKNQLIETLLTT